MSAVNVHMKVLDGWANVLPAKNGTLLSRRLAEETLPEGKGPEFRYATIVSSDVGFLQPIELKR